MAGRARLGVNVRVSPARYALRMTVRPFSLCLASAALLVGACDMVGLDRWRPTQEQILARGWAAPRPDGSPEPNTRCYRTLADAQCEPLPKEPAAKLP